MMWYWSIILFFFKQKTAYDMRISDWSSDVCSSDRQFNNPEPSCGDGRAVLNGAALFRSRKEVCGSFAIWGEKNLDAHPPNSKGIHIRFPGGGLDKGRIAKLPRQFLFLRPDERNGEITCVQFLRSPHSPCLRAAQPVALP